MKHVMETATINASPERLWDQIGSFQGVGRWHPWLTAVQGTGEHPGNVRKATGTDGSEQVERLVEMNPARHYYRYVMEQTAMPVTDYSAELRVRPAGDGESVVEWTADFEVAKGPDSQAMDMVQGFFHAGLDSVKQQYS